MLSEEKKNKLVAAYWKLKVGPPKGPCKIMKVHRLIGNKGMFE